MISTGILRRSSVLRSGKHLYIGNYRDFSLFEFAAPPRLQGVIVPTDYGVGIRSDRSPECTSVFKHTSDPLAYLNGDYPYRPIVTVDDITPTDKVLRGSGLHGPERTDILRLVLYNRLKVRQLQRLVPSKKESFEDHKVVVCSLWFTISSMLALNIMFRYGMDFGLVHEHYPWTPARSDGTRGPGPLYWITL